WKMLSSFLAGGFFFRAEDGIRAGHVTGVQTCALPISPPPPPLIHACIESAQARLLAGMKDLGGGGLSCVVGEMALAGGFGAEVRSEERRVGKEWRGWLGA